MLHCVNVIAVYGKDYTCSPRHGKTCVAVCSGYNALWFDISEIRCVRSEWSEDRRIITGYGFQLCSNGPLISWKSRRQHTVALSTCEAEYMALAAATQ